MRKSLRASDPCSLAPISDATSGMGAAKKLSGGNQKNNKAMKNFQTISINLHNLSLKSQVKSASVQDRILRRIVEKRQAQANHRKSKAMVTNEQEPLYWQKDLDDSQNDLIFAPQINLMSNHKN